jgi:hypothetical protein
MGYLLQQSSAGHPLLFLLVKTSDHLTGLTGASPTVTISKDGGSFASPSGAVSEVANGWYKVAGNATDTSTLGALLLHATATSGDPCDDEYRVVAYNPDDAVHLGLSSLPNVAQGASGAVPIGDASGRVTVITNDDKTGYALTSGEHTTIQSDVQTGLTGQGYTTTRAAKLDDLDATVSSRLAASSYTAPDNTDIVSALADLVVLVGRTDPTTAIAAIKTVTDKFAFSTSNRVDATALAVDDKTGYALTSGEHDLISGTDVPAALDAAGLDAAFVQQVSAILGAASVSGNVVTYATPDDAHHWTQTYSPSIDAATSVAVAQVD